jgi:predicted nucleic acid-binding protein
VTARVVVVSDTSPIRVLSHVSKLHLLAEFFDEVLIPPAVARELEAPESRTGSVSLAQIPKCSIRVPNDVIEIHKLEVELQTAEAEAIVLAREIRAELLIDERAGRLVAGKLGVPYVGVIGLLVRAKQKGLVEKVVPIVLKARDEMNFFVSDGLIEELRRIAAE